MAGLKLLIVEDDLASLELMTEVFRGLHAEVCPLSDSRAAATIVNQEKFDGIFLDLEMPNLHGLELAQKVRNSSWNKTTPIVVVTGREDRQTMQQSFATGAQFFLQKPVDRQKLSKLFRTVRGTMLDNRRRAVRAPMHTQISCSAGGRRLRGQTWNLSEGGILVEIAGLRSGEHVELSFSLPGSTVVLEPAGMVVWTKDGRQGVQFSKVSVDDLQRIREFIPQAEKQ